VNDLWHFDVPTTTWTLVAGIPNGYDASLPVPRHYYGQACDANGNFYVLGGYVSDTDDPPFFASDPDGSFAHPVTLGGAMPDPKLLTFGLADFWLFNAGSGRWANISGQLGDLGTGPIVPYAMAADSANNELVTFGGYHSSGSATLSLGSSTWVYGLPVEAGVMPPIPTIAPRPTLSATTTPAGTDLPSPTGSPGKVTGAAPASATPTVTSTPGAEPPTLRPGEDDNPPP
jgi:hypothetical protein